jgi:hypothetical protein
MTNGRSYTTVVVGTGSDAPVKFSVRKTFARSVFNEGGATGGDPTVKPAGERKIEVGVTNKNTVLVCKTAYDYVKNADGEFEFKKNKTYTKFDSLSAVVASLDATKPEEASVAFQMKDLKDWAAQETVEV